MHVRTIILALLLGTAALAESAQQIDTAPVQMRELPRQYLLDGTVEAVNQSTVSAQTRGQVEQILFDIDDYVEQGALIAVLRDTEQKARLDQAAAELKEAGARLQEARQEHSRIKDIYEKQLVSQSAMDKAGAQLKAARARNQAAEAGLEQAREQYEYTRIRAPYSGIVTQRYIEVGETANPGQRLMSGLSLDQLRVSVDVPQSLIADVRRVGKASIQRRKSNDFSLCPPREQHIPGSAGSAIRHLRSVPRHVRKNRLYHRLRPAAGDSCSIRGLSQ